MGWRSRRHQRRVIKMAFPQGLRAVRRYRRANGTPDLPGLWHTLWVPETRPWSLTCRDGGRC